MIQFNTQQSNNSFTVYPESSSIYAGDPSGSFSVTLTQDMDLSSGSFDVELINTPTQYNSRLVFQVSGSSIQPRHTGQYTFQLFETTIQRLIWGTQHTLFGDTHITWGQGEAQTGRLIDTDRVYLQGDNTPSFTTYTTTNESGSFTTYNQ